MQVLIVCKNDIKQNSWPELGKAGDKSFLESKRCTADRKGCPEQTWLSLVVMEPFESSSLFASRDTDSGC